MISHLSSSPSFSVNFPTNRHLEDSPSQLFWSTTHLLTRHFPFNLHRTLFNIYIYTNKKGQSSFMLPRDFKNLSSSSSLAVKTDNFSGGHVVWFAGLCSFSMPGPGYRSSCGPCWGNQIPQLSPQVCAQNSHERNLLSSRTMMEIRTVLKGQVSATLARTGRGYHPRTDHL